MSKNNNKKNAGIPKSMREGIISKEDLPKEVRELIKVLNANVTDDSGELIFNKETGIPISEMNDPLAEKVKERAEKIISEPLEPSVELDCENKEEKQDEADVCIKINYGTNGGKIKNQLKKQGFKFSKKFIKKAEFIRLHILTKSQIKFINKIKTENLFFELDDIISKHVMKKTFGKNHNYSNVGRTLSRKKK